MGVKINGKPIENPDAQYILSKLAPKSKKDISGEDATWLLDRDGNETFNRKDYQRILRWNPSLKKDSKFTYDAFKNCAWYVSQILRHPEPKSVFLLWNGTDDEGNQVYEHILADEMKEVEKGKRFHVAGGGLAEKVRVIILKDKKGIRLEYDWEDQSPSWGDNNSYIRKVSFSLDEIDLPLTKKFLWQFVARVGPFKPSLLDKPPVDL